MEQACRENVMFMALACGQRPDHSTIAAFVSSMQGEVKVLFRDVLLVCEESGLLGGTFFALDGCKLPLNASKEWSGKISDLVRKKEKMEKRVTELLRRQVEADKKEDEEESGKDLFRGLNRTKQIERVYLILDQHPVHKAVRVKKWLQRHPNSIKIFHLPSYSPDLNPDECLNQDVKSNAVGGRRPHTQDEMLQGVRVYLRSRQRQPHIVRKYFEAQSVSYAAL
jgi:hypothetical protein